MKIENHIHAVLPKLDFHIQRGSHQDPGSFTSYLIGAAEGLEGHIGPPANPIGIYPIDPPSDGSGEPVSVLSGSPVNPIVTSPAAGASNPAPGEAWQKIPPPLNPNGLYPIDPVSNNPAEDVSGLASPPLNSLHIL